MDPSYAQRYRELYERHWWWRAREAVICGALRRWATARPGQFVLDVGCGDGLTLPILDGFGTAQGVEADVALLDPAGPYYGRIHRGPFDETFRPPVRYGLITMLDVLEHMPDPAVGLRRALALLEADGRIVITVPAFRLLWTSHDDCNRHYTRYRRQDFCRLAESVGLKLLAMRYFFHWTFPVKLAQRIKESLLGASAVPARIPPRGINGFLYGLSRAEQAISWHCPVPFGSTLLIVGCHAGDEPSGASAQQRWPP